MSKLISGLKNNIDFNQKIDLYVPKKLNYDSRIKDLKNKYKTRNLGSTIKSCILFYMYQTLDINRELFEQIKFNKNINLFSQNKDKFESNITLKEFKQNFIEIKMQNWHFVYYLSKAYLNWNDSIFEGGSDFYEDIINFNDNIRLPLNMPVRKYDIEYGELETIFIKKLKVLHGTQNFSSTIKSCIFFYVHSMLTGKNDLKDKDKYINRYVLEHIEFNENKTLEIELPMWIEEYIELWKGPNDINRILLFNLQVYSNLFPEQRWK